jgi:adenosylcobinamide-GDP ribazoletransferase
MRESPTRAADAVRGAVAFLARVPVGRRPLAAEDVARGAVLFPLVGAGIGAAVGGTAVLLEPTFPALLAAALAVGVELVLTGALHVDGVADTADALGAPAPDRALEIMRDSRIGTFGACALVVDLLVRTAVITALLDRGGALVSLTAAGALGRAAILPLAALLPYARPGGGLSDRIGLPAAVVGGATAIGLSVGLAGWIGAAMVAAAALTTALIAVAYRRRFGGVTGDTLGAANQLVDLATIAVVAALAHNGLL